MTSVRFAARDPGAANVLAALLRSSALTHDHDVWTLPRATPIFGREGIEVREFATLEPDQVRAAWRANPARALVTGTSHYAPFEPLLWSLARQTGAPSLALLDSWMNLSRRFAEGRPDFVGAVDGEQASELAQLGFPADRILVTGHPFLHRLHQRLTSTPSAPRPLPGQPTRVLFVSEPIASDVEAGVNDPFGFTELDAFRVLHAAAVDVAARGIATELAVKFHPQEDRKRFLELIATLDDGGSVSIVAVPAGDRPEPWLERSHLVVGISSMLLLEAIAYDRPVVSLQPDLAREDTFVASRRGYVELLVDPARARARLASLFESARARDEVSAKNHGFLTALGPLATADVARWIERSLDGTLTRA